ncbi:uncharacterized protein LOC123302401 [Chrysoperla carnea]|uniref:uncharacterized protein LOC123302401 n=1 Tax=Chrysoperla carnea TaxID=189513 RepID=UPI001D06B310|nr:uncharacterized protein LOC123302401 [Chrysoperla carnea]
MKVSVCAQIFSRSVAAGINLMAKSEFTIGETKMERRATETAVFLKFMDDVFDSVNGCGPFNEGGKKLKTQIDFKERDSLQVKFWREAIPIFKSMECLDSSGRRMARPPTFKNWVFTLENLIILTNKLKDLGIETLVPRFLNQDPLENFSGKFVNEEVGGRIHRAMLLDRFTNLFWSLTLLVNILWEGIVKMMCRIC